MGWFDESDDEEAPTTKPRVLPSLEALLSTDEGRQPSTGQTEAEDPLDAYMKSLDREGDSVSKSNTKLNSNNRGEKRMDIQMEEDEDLSEELAQSKRKYTEDVNGEFDYDDQPNSASEARNALESTFRKESKRKQGAGPGSNPGETIPLEQNEMEKAPFRKVFWTAKDTAEGREWRKTNVVHCTASIDPMTQFDQLSEVLGETLINTIHQKGYEKPTLVQSQTLPVALSGCDVLVTAATGQGKTLAYIWPLVVHIMDQTALVNETGPIALVLVPTRELAQQVYQQARIMLAPFGGTAKAVIGGQGKYLLQQELKNHGGVELVVATPGRLLDVLSDKKGLSLRCVTAVVLDEADKMLEMGFESQVRQLLSAIRSDRQTLMLSATMGRRIEKVALEWLATDYVRISVGRTGESSRNVQQHVMIFKNDQMKEDFVLELLPALKEVGQTLVFVATREACERVASRIAELLPTLQIATLHGNKHQTDRTAALRSFAKGQVSTLIATDVAGRGLDIPNVATVVNFDQAKNLDTHVHRVGRAGRLSKEQQRTGSSYTLLTPKNASFANVLRNSFERERRPVSKELAELADRTRGTSKNNSNNFAGSVCRDDDRGASDRGPSFNGYSDENPSKRGRFS